MSPNQEYPLRFSPRGDLHSPPQGKYKLLELTQELFQVLESGVEKQFTIRGRITDDAVLCTSSKTYALRAVTLSNTIVVATAPSSTSASGLELIVRDEVSQILELVPAVPKLHRLGVVLKGCEWDEGHERDDEGSADEDDEGVDSERPRKRARFTRDTIRGEVQASDAELARGIKEFHILEMDGHLRPLSPSYLAHILETLLNALISQNLPLPPRAVSMQKLAQHLDLEHEIPCRVTEQVLPWFGEVEIEGHDGQWKMDQKEVVRQIGLGRLMTHKDDPAKISDFLDMWGVAVGDFFAPSIDLTILEGNYLATPAPTPTCLLPPTHLVYFPASALPTSTTLLFADLFLTRPRWRAEDIVPFLAQVAVDGKERDKLLMKYARATTDGNGGVWYSARATHG